MFFLYYFWTLFHVIYKPFHKYFNEFLLKYNIAYVVYSNKILSRFLDFLSSIFLNTWYYINWKNNKTSKILFLIKLRSNDVHIIPKFSKILKLKLFVKIFNTIEKHLRNKFFLFEHRNALVFTIFEDFVILTYFFKKYMYNYLNLFCFFNKHKNNIVKLVWLFIFKMLDYRKSITYKKQHKIKELDLIRFYDWYKYTFGSSDVIFSKLRRNKIHKNVFKGRKLYKEFQDKRFNYFLKIYKIYNENYSKILKNFGLFYKNIFILELKDFNIYKFLFLLDKQQLVNKYPIRFSESSINKYIQYSDIKNFNFFFLRKNRIFNKSRYSRNRQLYRTGVYWCLWLNIIIVYGLFFLFYRFTFNFGYLWFGIMFLLYSFIFSKVLKYNFINIFSFFKELYSLFQWYGYILHNIFQFTKKLIFSKFSIFNKLVFLKTYINPNVIYILDNKWIYKIINFYNKLELVIFKIWWVSFQGKDESFLRYKTIIHYFKQIINILIN